LFASILRSLSHIGNLEFRFAFAFELSLLEAPNTLGPVVAPVNGTARSIGNQSIVSLNGASLIRAYWLLGRREKEYFD